MNRSRLLAGFLFLALVHAGRAAPAYRTDINPALRYYQAYLEKSDFSSADRDYLFTKDWRGQPLGARVGQLLAAYDNQFRIISQAARAEVPCDWGIDLTEGPDALLVGLAPAKAIAQTARLRVTWHLQNGRQSQARAELLDAFALARNLSRDGVLISALVQIAMEHILCSTVVEDFYRWPPGELEKLVAGLDNAPARGTIAQCVPGEKVAIHDWLLRQVRGFQERNGKDDPKTLDDIRALLTRVESSEGSSIPAFADQVVEESESSAGVIKRIEELAPWYDRIARILRLPYLSYEQEMDSFMSEVRSSQNQLIPHYFAAFEKCRTKEFAVQAKLAMLRAAAEFKLHGEAGLKKVKDPFGDGPFQFERFSLNGEDRGFKLRSAFRGRGFEEGVIFVEKGGPPFLTDGPQLGEAIRR
jgi:hypothetical protein